MSVSESESRYPETTGYIYSECAKRLKKRKQALNLTDAEIAEGYDRKVVNRILNNTRTRNNPYLVPHAYVHPLVDKLGLQNDYTLFWGDANDEQFIETVFCNLLTDVLEEEREDSVAEIIEKVLLDDVGYAKIQPTVMPAYEYEDEYGDYLPISPYNCLSGDEHVSSVERRRIRHNAILRLWANTRPIKMFADFFSENLTFSKLEKRLDGFVGNSLTPFLHKNIPNENSLGMRVHSIITVDIKNYIELELANQTRVAAGFDKYLGGEYDELLQSLTSAGQSYIVKIEKLQARLDELLRKEKFG